MNNSPAILAIIAVLIFVGIQIKKMLTASNLNNLKESDKILKSQQDVLVKDVEAAKGEIEQGKNNEALKSVKEVEDFWNKK